MSLNFCKAKLFDDVEFTINWYTGFISIKIAGSESLSLYDKSAQTS